MVVRLVTMANPCSACLMIDNLLRELFQKVSAQMENVEFAVEVLNHPRECSGVVGLEVEKLPVVIIGDEQVTAGGLLHRRQLIQMIEMRMEENTWKRN